MADNYLLSNAQINNLINLCECCAQKILSYYKKPIEITQKLNDTPVTEADLAVSQLLEEHLPNIADFPVLSEEACPKNADWKNWQTYWLVDPIDGTKQFINQTDQFCILVALIHQNQPVLGVIYSPTEDCAWFTQLADTKALNQQTEDKQNITNYDYVNRVFYAEKHQKIKVWENTIPPPKPKVVISSQSISNKMSEFANSICLDDFYSVGSGLKYTELLKGNATIYPKMWPTCEWDTAAGHCLLKVLGGEIINLSTGKPLDYGKRDSLINPHFVAFLSLKTEQKNQLLSTYSNIKSKYELKYI